MKQFVKRVVKYPGNPYPPLEFYLFRPSWNSEFIKELLIASSSGKALSQLKIADTGAGFGGSRKAMVQAGCEPENVYEVEQNEELRRWSRDNGGVNVVRGTASGTHLPKGKFDIVAYFNSVQEIPEEDIWEVRAENQRILKPDGKIIIAAQRFDPQCDVINYLSLSCAKWQAEGLYPEYGQNGEFSFNEKFSLEHTKNILGNYSDLYSKKENQVELIIANETSYDKASFLGLLRSYPTFPASPPRELLEEISKFHDKHSDENGCVVILSSQIGIVGEPRAKDLTHCR